METICCAPDSYASICGSPENPSPRQSVTYSNPSPPPSASSPPPPPPSFFFRGSRAPRTRKHDAATARHSDDVPARARPRRSEVVRQRVPAPFARLRAAVVVHPDLVLAVQHVEPAVAIGRLRLLVQDAAVHGYVEDDEVLAVGEHGLAELEVGEAFAAGPRLGVVDALVPDESTVPDTWMRPPAYEMPLMYGLFLTPVRNWPTYEYD
ncbi:hypothetical protein ColKHC_12352 [Colletotrichum higginsianum]|nr:hypothetical protein ColKHC_12352 [Colletotrichum higginsianum]